MSRSRDQQPKRHCLRIAIRELRIVRLRKEKCAPVVRKAGQSRTTKRHLFDDLITQ